MGKWTVADRLKPIMGIKSDLREDLQGRIDLEYQIGYERKRIIDLVNYIIDTFLDRRAFTKVKVRESGTTLEVPKPSEIDEYGDYEDEYEDYSYYDDEDLKKGDIVSFMRRCLNQGYRLIKRGRGSYEYDGLRLRPKPS